MRADELLEPGLPSGTRSGGPTTPAETDALIDGIEASFARAAEASSVSTRDFRLAGYHVRLRSPQPTMLALLSRAFEHLASEPGPGSPDLTIDLWDSTTSSTPPPPMPEVGGERAPGAFFHYNRGALRLAYQLGTSGEGDERVLTAENDAPTPALSGLDSSRDLAWYWVEDVERIPYWDESTPLRYIFDWWLRDRGVHLIHAGAVGTSRGGVLLVGKGGSGKSTSTLAALDSDLQFAGDDYVGVSVEPEPWVHGLYSSGKLMPDHAERLPFLRPALPPRREGEPVKMTNLGPEKAIIYAHEHWPARLSAGFALRAILIPRVTPGRSEARIVETAPSVALAALAPSTVLQMHVDGQDSLLRMRRLAQSVPSYVLEAGSDIPSIPRAISALLAALETGSAR